MAARARAMAAPPTAHAWPVTWGAPALLELVDVTVPVAAGTEDARELVDALDAADSDAELAKVVGVVVGAVGVAPVLAAEVALASAATGTKREARTWLPKCAVYIPLQLTGPPTDCTQEADVVP